MSSLNGPLRPNEGPEEYYLSRSHPRPCPYLPGNRLKLYRKVLRSHGAKVLRSRPHIRTGDDETRSRDLPGVHHPRKSKRL